MAAPDELTAILGALVPGDGRLRFCRSNLEDLQAGDWIELSGPQGSESACIVFGPDQVEYPDAPDDLPRIQRRLTPDEIAELTPVARPDDSATARFGSLGRLRQGVTDLDAHIRARLRIDQAPELPHLGAIVQTPHGPGTLLSVSMRHQTATIRLESGKEIRMPVGDLD
jgi:hypothetical protein